MAQFTKPKKFNGQRLINELEAIGITITGRIRQIGDDVLEFTHDGDDIEIQKVLDVHKGEDIPSPRISAISKLRALGLTEEEIAAL